MALKSPYGELSLESIFFNIIPLQPLQLNYKIIYKLIKKNVYYKYYKSYSREGVDKTLKLASKIY